MILSELERKAAVAWLRTCASAFLAYGPDLVDAFGVDGVARAERFLLEAERSRFIERGANQCRDHRLWRSLVTFGVGGVAGGQPTIAAASPVLFGFAPLPFLLEAYREGGLEPT